MINKTKKRSDYFMMPKNEDDLSQIFRKYPTYNVLHLIKNETRKIFQSNTELKGAERVSFELYDLRTRQKFRQDAIIQSWKLIDMAYYAIKYSNDYRGKEIEDIRSFYMLSMATEAYEEVLYKSCMSSIKPNDPAFMFYLFGFGGEQFKIQEIGEVYDSFSRELYIMFECAQNATNVVNVEEIVSSRMETTWENVASSLQITWLGFLKNNTIEDIEKQIQFKNENFKKIYHNVIEKYTINYEEVRNSKIKRQVFYTKPYVRTKNSGTVGFSDYLNLKIYEHCIFWIVRDYYRVKPKGSQTFVSHFGECFEEYFKRLLDNTMQEHEYEHIKECGRKRADWKIEIGGYCFLIEQKSSILELGSKQQQTDVDATSRYLTKTVVEALEQLKETEDDLHLGKCIKIVMLYDDYLLPAVLDSIFMMDDCKVENDNYYWMVNISEMEKLLITYKNNPKLFSSIVEEKIRREENHSLDGKDLELILRKFGVYENEYLKRKEIQKYSQISLDNVKEIIW